MHSLLETYLSEVAAHLNALPPKRRAEELREMRAHLENAIIVNRELGQSESEAAQNAVAQFGTARDLGENVVWAWRRGRTLNRRSFWGAAVCALLLSFLLPSLRDTPLGPPLVNVVNLLSNGHGWAGGSANLIVNIVFHSLAGGICGLIFPKRALSGTVLGLLGGYATFVAMLLIISGTERSFDMAPIWAKENALSCLFAISAAWAGSRWRNARVGRARLARG